MMGVLLWIILIPFRILWFAIKTLLRLIFAPFKMAVSIILAIAMIAGVAYLVIKYFV